MQKQLCEAEAKTTKPLTSFIKPVENKAYQTDSAVENETESITEDMSVSGQQPRRCANNKRCNDRVCV
jgi:hypothetical protein